MVVTAGKPSELAFKLSKLSYITAGRVTFSVKNAGKIGHTFEICLTTSATATANKCKGKGKTTPLLQSGKSSTLTVTLAKGVYEFLCTFPGHASAGMKGLLGIGVKVKPPVQLTTTAVTTTTPATTTTRPQSGDGCPPGQTIVSIAADDHDDDDSGAPSDGDGCV